MTRLGQKGVNKVVITLLILLVFGALAAFVIHQVFLYPDISKVCLEVLPQDKRVGIKFEQPGKDQLKIDLSGQRGVQAGATPQQIDAFVRCLEVTGRKVTIENGVRVPLEPVGQLANRWRREHGLQLRLMPGSNDEALNNLGIGQATGLKEDVIRDWCSKLRSCVSCDPSQPTADTVEVLVRLKDDAPLEKRQLGGLWPVPQPGVQAEPWQLVSVNGERFYYECRRP